MVNFKREETTINSRSGFELNLSPGDVVRLFPESYHSTYTVEKIDDDYLYISYQVDVRTKQTYIPLHESLWRWVGRCEELTKEDMLGW